MDLDSPCILNTPSLMTPNISETPLIYKPSSSLIPDDVTTETSTNEFISPLPHGSTSKSTTSNSTDDSSIIASSEDKLSEIENDLKQSVIQPRRPTESPFFSKTISSTSVLSGNKSMTGPELTVPPSTAEIVSDIESFDKDSTVETSSNNGVILNRNEINSIPSETNLNYETSPVESMGVIVSPKKRFIIRSQSRTDSTSPNPTVPTQSQKSSSEEDNYAEENPFQRAPEPIFEAHPMLNRTSLVVFNGKRSIPNEVTSSDPTIGMKRQKITSNHSLNFRTSIPIEPMPIVNDDQRRKQIRDSNREAARRCRERRRKYIEELEGTLEQHKNQIKQVTDKLIVAERENSQLKAILNEMKMFQTRRIQSNEKIVEYSPMVNATDGNLLHQRNFHSRTAH